MGLLDRLPGGKRMREAKQRGRAFVYSQGANVIEMLYKKAFANFKVMGFGLRSGMPIPKVVKKCRNFYKQNWKDGEWSEKSRARMDEVFANIEAADYKPEDAVWVEKSIPRILSRAKEKTKSKFMGIVTWK